MESWAFGQAVRRWRDRAAPQAAGVPAGGRRRAAGLRREELAGLAGISVDYLTRLEQGRATSPSSQVVEALARALRLSGTERELLFRLAGQAAPGRDVVPARIPPSVQRLLDRLSHTPVAVHDAAWNLGVTSRCARSLLGRCRISAARTARSAQSRWGRGWVRRRTATLCRSTSSSAFFDADERAEQDQPPADPDEDQIEQTE